MSHNWPPIRVARFDGESDSDYEGRRSEVVAIVTGFRKGYFTVELGASLDERLDNLLTGAGCATHDPFGVIELVKQRHLAPVPGELIAGRLIAWPDKQGSNWGPLAPVPRTDANNFVARVVSFPQESDLRARRQRSPGKLNDRGSS